MIAACVRAWRSVGAGPGTLVAVALSFAVSGCTRSAHWTEEVPLNTGETIWVERHGTYRYGSESGNPLEFGYQADPRTRIAFEYRGKRYTHAIDTELQILAIAPDGTPNLVTVATNFTWQWNNGHYCTRPSNVQFRPDASGRRWTALPAVEPWLYGLPTNLLIGLPPASFWKQRITAASRADRHRFVYVAGDVYRWLDPTYQHPHCRRRLTSTRL